MIVISTVAHIVKNVVERQPFLEEAIARGIVNYTELAKLIKADVEKELGKPVNHAAVMMAIRRLGESLEVGYPYREPVKFEWGGITIKSGLFEITVQRSERAIEKILDLHKLIDYRSGDFLTVTQGIHEITVISNKKYQKRFEEALRNMDASKVIKDLASLTVSIPVSGIETVGYFYVLTKALNWNNINIIEIVSTLTELTFLLKEKDVAVAFDTVGALLKREEGRVH